MYTLQVNGMSCGGCAASVKRAVQSVDNAAEVNVDLPAKTVTVKSTADLGAIRGAITDAGYPVTSSTIA